jgi:hypothetical protein
MNGKAQTVAAAFLFSVFSLRAGTLTVTSLADSGPGSLRDQVGASAAGDTIVFAVTGTILLNSSINIPHTLDVFGPGPGQLVVNAQHVDRAFVTSGNPVFLAGMTITNGFIAGLNGPDATSPAQNGGPGLDAYGGAILDNGPSLYVSNCWVTGNTVQGGRGGAGANNPVGAAFKPGNGGGGGQGLGGALYAPADVFVINCTFSGNRAVGGSGGAGGTNFNGSVNEAGGIGGDGGAGQGGAVDESNSGGRSFKNVTFSGNRLGGGSGGRGGDSLDGAGGQGGNGGTAGGGAVATLIASFSSDTIVSNSALGGVGGVGGNGGPPGSNGSQGAGTAGGVIGYLITCQPAIDNTIIADNFASGSYPNFFIAWTDDGYNFLGTDDQYICAVNGPGTQMGTLNNPLHPQLGPLAQNGGGMPTHAVLLTSPVLDAGNSFGTTFGVTNDERFAPRPYDLPFVPNLSGGDGSDIGAFELGAGGLGATQDTNGLVVSWPAFYGDCVLQSTTNFPGSNTWTDVLITPVAISNQFVVTNPIVDVSRFYRLINRPATQ